MGTKPPDPIIQFIWSTWEASCQYWRERRQASWNPSLSYLIRLKVGEKSAQPDRTQRWYNGSSGQIFTTYFLLCTHIYCYQPEKNDGIIIHIREKCIFKSPTYSSSRKAQTYIKLWYVFRYWKHISKATSKWNVWHIFRWEIIEIPSLCIQRYICNAILFRRRLRHWQHGPGGTSNFLQSAAEETEKEASPS